MIAPGNFDVQKRAFFCISNQAISVDSLLPSFFAFILFSSSARLARGLIITHTQEILNPDLPTNPRNHKQRMAWRFTYKYGFPYLVEKF